MLADQRARRGKAWQPGVIEHDKNRESNILLLHEILKTKTYRTSSYTTFKIYEPKERTIFRLPYFPDRITHHAIMNILKPIFMGMFTADTFSCIEGKGIHDALDRMKIALCDRQNTTHCLKLDIKKFYPSIDHNVLKCLLRKKFKDDDLLWILDEIIDSTDGLPIGNYLSQYLANFCLAYFDHWIKSDRRVRNYFRYADDLVILDGNKTYLHQLLRAIEKYFQEKLRLEVKDNYQLFPVDSRGIDFLGYVFFHDKTRIRKSIKKNFARMLKYNPNPASINSYLGWMKHADTKHLLKKLLPHDKVQRPGDNNISQKLLG